MMWGTKKEKLRIAGMHGNARVGGVALTQPDDPAPHKKNIFLKEQSAK